MARRLIYQPEHRRLAKKSHHPRRKDSESRLPNRRSADFAALPFDTYTVWSYAGFAGAGCRS